MNANPETMLELTSEKLYWAIGRCFASQAKGQRIKVRRITKSMVGVKTPHSHYIVDLAHPKAGLKLGRCSCKGAQGGRYCYHLAAAAACPGTVLHEAPSPVNVPVTVKRVTDACKPRPISSPARQPEAEKAPLSASAASPTEQPATSPAGPHAQNHNHKCKQCGVIFPCNLSLCAEGVWAIRCDPCYKARPEAQQGTVLPVTITIAKYAHARAC